MRIRMGVSQAYEEGTYRLTPKLFVYRDGKFDEFRDTAPLRN